MCSPWCYVPGLCVAGVEHSVGWYLHTSDAAMCSSSTRQRLWGPALAPVRPPLAGSVVHLCGKDIVAVTPQLWFCSMRARLLWLCKVRLSSGPGLCACHVVSVRSASTHQDELACTASPTGCRGGKRQTRRTSLSARSCAQRHQANNSWRLALVALCSVANCSIPYVKPGLFSKNWIPPFYCVF